MSALTQSWYRDKIGWLNIILLPLTGIYVGLLTIRRLLYRIQAPSRISNVPVIVVGNITVGGTGKTPLVQYLCYHLQQAGYRPGIVSRGYGCQTQAFPFIVKPEGNAIESGDEPYLHAINTDCPVVIDPNRNQAIQHLLQHFDCNVVISDDGLQHLAMHRDIEILVVDGQRVFGNQLCLPSGPLREPVSRAQHVDFVVVNGTARVSRLTDAFLMQLDLQHAYALSDKSRRVALTVFAGQKVHAVAGIGNPQRFFDALSQFNIQVIPHPLADHASIAVEYVQFSDDFPVLITEKDAVKCQSLEISGQVWVVPVITELDIDFKHQLLEKLEQVRNEY